MREQLLDSRIVSQFRVKFEVSVMCVENQEDTHLFLYVVNFTVASCWVVQSNVFLGKEKKINQHKHAELLKGAFWTCS